MCWESSRRHSPDGRNERPSWGHWRKSTAFGRGQLQGTGNADGMSGSLVQIRRVNGHAVQKELEMENLLR